jgi:hypothetical protein
MFEYVISATKA